MPRPRVEPPVAPAGASAPDALLVKRAKRDPEAFGLLYERYVDRIYSYIYFRTGSEQDAEDLTARTFFQALTNIRRYHERGLPFSAWLYRLAHNLMANWHRDRERRPQVSLDDVWALLAHGQDSPPSVAERERRIGDVARRGARAAGGPPAPARAEIRRGQIECRNRARTR